MFTEKWSYDYIEKYLDTRIKRMLGFEKKEIIINLTGKNIDKIKNNIEEYDFVFNLNKNIFKNNIDYYSKRYLCDFIDGDNITIIQ